MTAAGSFYENVTSADIAFIIVPFNEPITIRGFATDDLDRKWTVDYVLYQGQLYTADAFPGVTVPEPASLGILAIGALSLLARRRRSS